VGLSLETASAVYFIAIWTLRATIVVAVVASIAMFVAGKITQHKSRLDSKAAAPQSSIEISSSDASRAKPDQRPADVHPIAEQAELPLVSSETRPERRSIDGVGKSILIARLSRFSSTELDILVFYADSADALPLAITISQTLEAAGWSVRIWNGPLDQSIRGLRVQTREGADRAVQEPGVQLMLALQEIGLAARGFESFRSEHLLPDDSGVMAGQNRKLAPIRLMIGAKP
jgi:hypothetical protein